VTQENMTGLSAPELLNIWERGLTASPIQKALIILSSACQDMSIKELSRLSIGNRDALLMYVLENNFGHILACATACPSCSEKLELTLRSDDLRAPMPGPLQVEADLKIDEYEIRFRLPDSLDLGAASLCSDLSSARQVLIERCILEANRDGQRCKALGLPRAVIDAVSSRMEEMDPQANLQIDLTCPSCSTKWSSPFDVMPFLWVQLDAWAKRTLREVHLLASSYGWSEAEILAMSQWRRQAYLEMI
jgi:hypothetical protein